MFNFISIIVGAVGFIWFLVPVFSGIFNFGTVFGLLTFGLLFLSGALKKKVRKCLDFIKGKKYGKTCLRVFAFCAAALFSFFVYESVLIISSAVKKTENKSAVVVVLGCQVNGEKPSRMLRQRIDIAFDYLEENPQALCILSGGKGEDEDISEAECMRRILTEKGISPERLYLEDKSTSTRENIAYIKEILDENFLGNEIIIATNEFHQYRASFIAGKNGLKCSALSTQSEIYLLPTYFMREFLAIPYEWLIS